MEKPLTMFGVFNLITQKQKIMEKKIKSISLTKMTNADHLDFHTKVKLYVEKCGAENISCTQELTLYQAEIDKEATIIYRQSGSALTAELEAKDSTRDGLLSYFIGGVSNAKNSPLPADRDAHEQLSLVLKPFKGIADETNPRESAQIISLIAELKQESLAGYIKTLGLDSVIGLIETANNEYITLDQQRTSDVPSKRETNELRARIDSIYHSLMAKTEGTVLLMTNASAETLVVDINNLIDANKKAYSQRTAERKTTPEKQEE